ncbi:CPBP family intramembrane metalloprotease [Catenovulum sp. 2E275]|uniref:CPBP family intramembrane glutamic endopeptidase n=1 Tax=Catenovulum sp. 2E275 TaxID=2980497 RepID=UPI0021CF084A|nr:type II CAAX endopeptidase family protein [Catenovulum sp. 2E275]MCU4676870.1 CPBP family intramembrane metalloprotease [Catenovulum sp. 2E275]
MLNQILTPLILVISFILIGFSFALPFTTINPEFSTLWLGVSGLLYLCFRYYYRASIQYNLVKILSAFACVLFAAAFAVHLFDSPSFFITQVQFSSNAEQVNIYYNFDKLILGLIVLCSAPSLLQRSFKTKPLTLDRALKLLLVFSLSCLVIFLTAIALQLVALDVKTLPLSLLSIWAFKNLVLVCFGEELLFRGFIQTELAKWHPNSAWLITAALFGLAHLPAGVAYAMVATMAGLLYGWIYLKTDNILYPILAHFGFNCLHLVFFTYPYLIVSVNSG